MHRYALGQIGWKPAFERQIAFHSRDEVTLARVSIHHGTAVGLIGERGEFAVPVQNARAAGDIGVGDWLVLGAEDHRAVQRLERTTALFRQAPHGGKPQLIAANVDTLFIVTSCNDDFNLPRLERYLTLALQSSVRPVVVLTKVDLCADPDVYRREVERLRRDLAVVALDVRDPEQARRLHRWCGPGETVALLGSSGVGKSTLANALGAEGQATGSIREQDGKGRHTTTARSLHLLPTGGVLVDNPGVRELQLASSEEAIVEVFDDFFEVATRCRFNNCRHGNDKGCAVRAAIRAGELDAARLERFKNMLAEHAELASKHTKRPRRNPSPGRKIKPDGVRRRGEDEAP